MIGKKTAFLALAACLTGGAASADGDYVSPTNARFALTLGAVEVSPSTVVRVDSKTGTLGTTFNGENDFGLDSHRIEPKFDLMLRAGERHRLFFDYFTLDRSDTKNLAFGPANFGDVVLLEGDPVQAELSLRVLERTYGYSFWHSEKLELTGTISINDTEVSSSVRVQTPTRHVYDSQSTACPFPTPGITATYVASKRFYFDGTFRYMRISIDHLEGSTTIYDFEALYRFRPNVSFGLGYSGVRADLLSRKSTDTGYFDFDSKGPEVFVRVAF